MQTKNCPKRGRPSHYSAEIADMICGRLAECESLRAICARTGMPNKATVFRWIARHNEFRDHYTMAREFQRECLADEALEIALNSRGDYARLRLNALHRMAGWMAAKKYRPPR
jgi:hypothetical protein